MDSERLASSGRLGDSSVTKSTSEAVLNQLSQPSQTILTAFRENSNWSKLASSPTVQFTENVRPGGKIVQSLNVTLNPVELGRVELNMRLIQGQVTIDVKAETDQAYRALLVDQDVLTNNLRSLGFKVDAITVSGPQGDAGAQFQNMPNSEDRASNDGFEAWIKRWPEQTG